MKREFTMVLMLLLGLLLISCQQTSATTYIVTFDSQGGDAVAAQTVNENQQAQIPDDPFKENYRFVSWQLEGEDYDFSMPVTTNITLVATYESKLYSNPVWEPILADPSIIRHEGIYYAFGTQDDGVWSATEFGVKYGPIIQSENLVDWTYTGSVFSGATRPGWGTLNAGTWALDIVKINDTFVLYYSLSTWGDPNPGIGVATASHPAGPWTDQGKLFDSEEIGVNNSIDPAVFTAQDGTIYMIWGSFRGIYGVELTDDGLSLAGGLATAASQKILLAGNDTSVAFDINTYEGAYIVYKDDYYYMFLSTGSCCNGVNSTYNVVVGRSKNPLGPYVDDQGRSMKQGNVGFQVVMRSSAFSGVGHNSVTQDDQGDYWIVYHGYDLSEPDSVGNSSRRSLLIDKLIWNENGWPYVENLQPSNGTAEKPFING